MTADIIHLASRQQTKALCGLPTPSEVISGSPGMLSYAHSPSLFALPFVALPSQECSDWGEFWKRTTMWNDDPTGAAGHVDYSRGKRYAREAIVAIISDGASPHSLTMVVDAIVDRGFKRRGPGGRPCRVLSSAEEGFLHELCEIAVEAARQLNPSNPQI
jgi:hypothetical protein